MNTFQELDMSGSLGDSTVEAFRILRRLVQEQLLKYDNFTCNHENSRKFIESEKLFLNRWLEVNTESLFEDMASEHIEL